MSIFLAYLLTVLTMPVVGVFLFLVTMPLLAVVPPRSDLYPATWQAASSVAKCFVAYLIFDWFDVPFGLTPVVVIGVLATFYNTARLYYYMQAYGARMEMIGMRAGMDSATLTAAVQHDDEARSLYTIIGNEIAYTIGGILGTVIAGWWLLTW